MLQHSVVHKLPQNYRWLAGFTGTKVEPVLPNQPAMNNCLIALKLLSPSDERAWSVIQKLSQALTDIEIHCSVLECEGEPCLFINRQDEGAATCQLKNVGVAIAESVVTPIKSYQDTLQYMPR